VVATVPLIQNYLIDIDSLLARVAKLISSNRSLAFMPHSPDNLHGLFKRLRGHQIDVASDELLIQLMSAIFNSSDLSVFQTSAAISEAMDRVKQAAAHYNVDAASHLSDDLTAASESIFSSMCVQDIEVFNLPCSW
jgi:hypothetical protein